MRTTLSLAALLIGGALFAQVATKQGTITTKQIMVDKAIPDSNALFDAGGREKPTDQEWAEFKKHALSLTEAGNMLMKPGQIATGATKVKSKAKANAANPAAWNAAAKLMADAGKAAAAAIDKKDLDLLGGDVGEKILNSCSACHDKYMIK
jgi:cytochrome c556